MDFSKQRSVDCPADERLAVIGRVAEALRNDSRVLDVVDGVRALFGNGRCLLQALNMVPLLDAHCEAHDEGAADEILAVIEEYVAKARA